METPTVSERSLWLGKTLTKKMLVYVGLIALLFALLLVFSSSGARADTLVPGGAIAGTQTWDNAGSPYIIQGDVWVTGDLTIDGSDGAVSVLFDGPYLMTVNGSLSVQGELPGGAITFENSTTSSAYWDGIWFNTADDSSIVNASFFHANDGLSIEDTDVELMGIQFNDVLGSAIQYVITDDLDASMEDVNINGAYEPIIVVVNDDVDVELTLSTVSILYPGEDAVEIISNIGTPQNVLVTASDCSFSAAGVGYQYAFQIETALSATINLASSTIYDAGTVIEAFSAGGNVSVEVSDGSRLINGNVAITAISLADGSQVMVGFNDSEISGWNEGISGTATNGTVRIYVDGSTIEDIGASAISATSNLLDALVSVSGDSYINNTYYGVLIQANTTASVLISESEINNTVYAIYATANVFGVELAMDDSEILGATYGLDVTANSGDIDMDLSGVEIDAFYPATLNAPDGGVNLDVADSVIDVLSGSSNDVSIAADGLIDINLDNVTIANGFNGVTAYSDSGDIELNAVDCLFEYIIGNALQIVANDGTVTITLTDDIFDETATMSYVAAVYANSLSDLSVTTNGVQVINSSWGFALWNTNDTITLDFTDTVLNGTYMLRGIWTGSTNGNIIVNIDGLSLVMMDAILSDDDYDAIHVVANTSIVFDATDLLVNFGFDAVHLETDFEGVTASFTDFAFTNFAGDGVFIDSAADVVLTVEGGLLNNTALANQWLASWGMGVFALTGIEASITDVEMITLVNGVELVTVEGDILATMDNVDMISFDLLFIWQDYLPINGVLINAINGSVEVSITDVSIETIIYAWSGAAGVQIYANDSIDLVIDGLDIANDYNGLWVESYYGDIDASIVGLVVNNTDNVGASFYADDGAIDLLMSNSTIAFVGSAGLVVQAVYETEVSLTDVAVLLSDGDGIIVLVTMENLLFDATNLYIYNIFGSGIDLVAANGLIEASIDPSVIEDAFTGLFIDAALSVDLIITDTLFEDNFIGIEIHSATGGVNILLDNATFDANFAYGMFVSADNDNIVLEMSDSLVNGTFGIGIFLLTYNGTVDVNVDDSVFSFDWIGMEIDSTLAVTIDFNNVTFDGCGEYGLYAYAEDEGIVLNVQHSLFNDTDDTAIYLETNYDDIDMTINVTTFYLGDYGVDAESAGNVNAVITNSFFLGQSEGGVSIYADGDAFIMVDSTVYDGQAADNAEMFFPSGVASSYAIVNPGEDNWTTGYQIVNLPFDFQFNGAVYDQITMSVYGWLGFGDVDPYETYSFGSDSPNIIAPAQFEWTTYEFPGIGYKVNDSRGAFAENIVFQWYVWDSYSSQLKNVFEVWLYPNGDIEFRYAVMEGINWEESYISEPDYGVNFEGGLNWNLRLLENSWLDNSWKSFYFNMEQLSSGYGLAAFVYGNITFASTNNDVSHYQEGGFILLSGDEDLISDPVGAVAGWIDVTVVSTDFSYIITNPADIPYFDTAASALLAATVNGTIDATVSDSSFAWIYGSATTFLNINQGSGENVLILSNNEYFEVMFLGVAATELLTPADLEEFTYNDVKSLTGIFANHVGPFFGATLVMVDTAVVTITQTEIIEDNTIIGNVDPFFVARGGMIFFDGLLELLNMPMDLMENIQPSQVTLLLANIGMTGSLTINHDVSVVGNTFTDAGWEEIVDEGDYYYTQPIIGAVSVYDATVPPAYGETIVDPNDYAKYDQTVQKTLNFVVVENTVSVSDSEDATFASGITATDISWILSSEMAVYAEATFTDNSIDLGYWYGDALGLAVISGAQEGKGNVYTEVDFNAVSNNIIYAGDGISLYVNAGAYNQWGDAYTVVTANVADNLVYVSNDGIDVNLYSNAIYSHYFPMFEQNVTANATLIDTINITNNVVQYAYSAIEVDVDSTAQESYYGVFAHANATETSTVTIVENNVYGWENGIDAEAYLYAYGGNAVSTGNLDVTIENNVVSASTYYEADGIEVYGYAYSWTLPLRFDDRPTTDLFVTAKVNNNQVNGGGYGIEVTIDAEVDLGRSVADAQLIADVTHNELTGYSQSGILVDGDSFADYQEGNYYYAPQASVLLTGMMVLNNLTTYWEDADGIEAGAISWDGYFAAVSGTVTVMYNNIVGGDGIYVYSGPVGPVSAIVTDNVITETGIGIEAEMIVATIARNIITNATEYGIELDGATGIVVSNEITGVYEESSTGIGVFNSDGTVTESVLIQYNDITNFGDDGIFVEEAFDLTITQNTITTVWDSGIEIAGTDGKAIGPMDGYGSEFIWITDNVITDAGEDGIFAAGVEDLDINNNMISMIGNDGIEIEDSAYVNIADNVISSTWTGIEIDSSYMVDVLRNILSAGAIKDEGDGELPSAIGIGGEGVDLWDDSWIDVSWNSMNGFGNGADVDEVSNLIFANNTIVWSLDDGATFDGVEFAMISDNVFNFNAGDGVEIANSTFVKFANNEVRHNDMIGLSIDNESYAITIVNGVYIDNALEGIQAYSSVVWYVDGVSAVENNDVELMGSLYVQAGGMLTLDSVDFAILGDFESGLSIIEVAVGGEILAMDVAFYLDVFEFEEPIAADMADYYEFNVYGTIEFYNVDISDALELYLGPTSQATIMTSTIMFNARNGVHIDGCNPVIMSTSIVNNPRFGIYIENGAAPRITDCMIAMNSRGIYAVATHLEDVTDNVFALNYQAGVFAEQVVGSIHDNIFLLNHKEIYVRDSNVSIADNQIGYTHLVDVIAQFAPLLAWMNVSGEVFLPSLGLYIDTGLVSSMLVGHIGVYAVNSTVVTDGNTFGMLTTAVQVVDSQLTFNDQIKMNTLILPYLDANLIIRNMSLPVPVFDGIIATHSVVEVTGGSIEVLDDAIFLDGSTATLNGVTLKAMDFDLYLIHGSQATASDITMSKAKAEDTSVLTVKNSFTIVVEDPWGATLANVPVTLRNAGGTLVASGSTGGNGAYTTSVVAYVLTSAGKDGSMSPYSARADYSEVPTSGYPGHSDSWSPAVVIKTASVSGPTTVVIQTSLIVRFDLVVLASTGTGSSVAGSSVVVMNAMGETVATGVTGEDGKYTALVIGYIQNPTGKDSTMNPYGVTVTYPSGILEPAKIQYDPQSVSGTATMNGDMQLTVKTGVIVYHTLFVTAKTKENMTAAGVWIVARDAQGVAQGEGPTDANGSWSVLLVGQRIDASGNVDTTMNPYNITAAFDSGLVVAPADMCCSDVALEIKELTPPFDWVTAGAVVAAAAALVLVAALLVSSRKP